MPKTKKKQNIKYGNVDIPEEAFAPHNSRIRISMLVRGDVLLWFKERSETVGIPYQNIMQLALAEYMIRNSSEEALDMSERRKQIIAKEMERLRKIAK